MQAVGGRNAQRAASCGGKAASRQPRTGNCAGGCQPYGGSAPRMQNIRRLASLVEASGRNGWAYRQQGGSRAGKAEDCNNSWKSLGTIGWALECLGSGRLVGRECPQKGRCAPFERQIESSRRRRFGATGSNGKSTFVERKLWATGNGKSTFVERKLGASGSSGKSTFVERKLHGLEREIDFRRKEAWGLGFKREVDFRRKEAWGHGFEREIDFRRKEAWGLGFKREVDLSRKKAADLRLSVSTVRWCRLSNTSAELSHFQSFIGVLRHVQEEMLISSASTLLAFSWAEFFVCANNC